MNKVNFQRQLDELVSEWQRVGVVPRVLLHSCCAPCSSYVLEYLSHYCRITVYYYNPNITNQEEYTHRIEEVQRLIAYMNARTEGEQDFYPIEFVAGPYEPRVFTEAVRGLEHEPEGGRRCEVCFRLRLSSTAKLAHQLAIPYFTTSLTISPLKDAQLLNRIGQELAGQYDTILFLPSDFKKRGGYLRSIELSRELNLYRQNYCGCVYSLVNNTHKA